MQRGLVLAWALLAFGCETRALLVDDCIPSECAGCCSEGRCIAVAQQTQNSCGLGGAQCGACPNTACENGVCQPCDSRCDGCCANGRCISPLEQSANSCGAQGAACQSCGSGQCLNGACKPASLCGECAGCCSGGVGILLCVNGDSANSCGSDGVSCRTCAQREQCVRGVCTLCSPANCSGCCDFFGNCVSGQSDENDCGTGGETCAKCGLGTCVAGQCR